MLEGVEINDIYSGENNGMEKSHETARKRKKLSQEEKMLRSRERNRVHARKTRARKKHQAEALQNRIVELKNDGDKLRQLVDERYTASVLLGLSQTVISKTNDGVQIEIKSSRHICGDAYGELMANPYWNSATDASDGNISASNDVGNGLKRLSRRRSKCSPQEREKIRRERNRMHAKRTRDRKKMFLEASENVIHDMEEESSHLRKYLVDVGVMTVEASNNWRDRDMSRRYELAALSQVVEGAEEDNDDGGEDDNLPETIDIEDKKDITRTHMVSSGDGDSLSASRGSGSTMQQDCKKDVLPAGSPFDDSNSDPDCNQNGSGSGSVLRAGSGSCSDSGTGSSSGGNTSHESSNDTPHGFKAENGSMSSSNLGEGEQLSSSTGDRSSSSDDGSDSNKGSTTNGDSADVGDGSSEVSSEMTEKTDKRRRRGGHRDQSLGQEGNLLRERRGDMSIRLVNSASTLEAMTASFYK